MPNLFIIAGPNGAGKTTYAQNFLAEEMQCHEFVNADLIAREIAPSAPGGADLQAGRIMIRRLRHLLAERRDFAFETTLSAYGYVPLLQEARAAAYRIRLDFLWVGSLDIARERVRQRVRKGGHDVPDHVQQRRFGKGIRMLFEHYRPLLDYWRLYDNTGGTPKLVVIEKDRLLNVADATGLACIERAASMRLMPEIPPRALEEALPMTFDDETRRSLRAMRRAYARVVLENLSFGLPVIQWREDRGLIAVPAERLAPFARRILEVNGEPLPVAEEQELLRGAL